MHELPEKFKQKYVVSAESGCHVWVAGKDGKGYGAYYHKGKRYGAHRFAYTFLVGPVSEGFELDHLCRNPACVNPRHLEPVTHRENVMRGLSPVVANARKTSCPKGHALAGGNLIIDGGKRKCRVCRNEQKLKTYYARRGELKAHRNAVKTHCKRGHALEGSNVMLKAGGARNCRECHNARRRKTEG